MFFKQQRRRECTSCVFVRYTEQRSLSSSKSNGVHHHSRSFLFSKEADDPVALPTICKYRRTDRSKSQRFHKLDVMRRRVVGGVKSLRAPSAAQFFLVVALFVAGVIVGMKVWSVESDLHVVSEARAGGIARGVAHRVSSATQVPPYGASHDVARRQSTPEASSLDRVKDIADDRDDDEWPLHAVQGDEDFFRVHRLAAGSRVRCVSRGMQQKCLFHNLVVHRNRLFVYHPRVGGGSSLRKTHVSSSASRVGENSTADVRNVWTEDVANALDPVASASYPNPIFPPDGQQAPLVQNHKYHGHAIRVLPDTAPPRSICTRVVKRPVLFLFRMSGHSTYHLWENNLGPFFATLQDSFGVDSSVAAKLKAAVNNPSELLISFVDSKPREGPKAPKLLDQLLRLFSDTPLLNATQLSQPTCIQTAIVGISANSFPHRSLVREVQRRMLNHVASDFLPEKPNMIYISRNHPSVTRGRKMVNEDAVYPVLNKTMFDAVGKPVPKVFMEDLSFREQLALASRTQIMFSPHGGGVANCIWMTPGSVMVEFVAPVGKTLPGMYHSMCSNSGVKHFHFLADPDPRDSAIRDNPRLFSNLIMPVDRMIENAQKALKLYAAERVRRMTR